MIASKQPCVPNEAARGVRNRRELLWLAAVAVGLSAAFLLNTWDYDDFWHVAAGRWIVEQRAVPRSDPFTFTVPGQRWVAVPWLSDSLFYVAYLLEGWAGVALLRAACAAAVLFALGASLRELRVPRLLALSTLPMAAVLLQPRLSRARGETFGEAMLALAVYLAIRAVRRRDRSRWLLVPVVALWLPMHTGAVLGVIVAAAAVVALLIERHTPRDLAAGAALVVACALPFVATVTGRDALLALTEHSPSRNPVVMAITREWAAPVLQDPANWVPLAMLVGALAHAASRARRDPLPLLLAGFAAFLALQAERHAAPAVALAWPAFGLALAALASRLARSGSALMQAAASAAVLILPLAHLALSPVERNRTAFGLGVESSRFPEDTLATLLTLPRGRALNELHMGGYLLWRQIPGGVFWDGRSAALFTEAQLRDVYLAPHQGPDALEALADRYDITYAFGSPSGDYGAPMMVSPLWVPLHHGSSSTLFVRRARLDSAVAAGARPLMLLRWLPDEGWLRQFYGALLRRPEDVAQLEAEFVSALSQTPNSPVLYELLAFFDAHSPPLAVRLRRRLPAPAP
jgi:hypothetical protein